MQFCYLHFLRIFPLCKTIFEKYRSYNLQLSGNRRSGANIRFLLRIARFLCNLPKVIPKKLIQPVFPRCNIIFCIENNPFCAQNPKNFREYTRNYDKISVVFRLKSYSLFPKTENFSSVLEKIFSVKLFSCHLYIFSCFRNSHNFFFRLRHFLWKRFFPEVHPFQ